MTSPAPSISSIAEPDVVSNGTEQSAQATPNGTPNGAEDKVQGSSEPDDSHEEEEDEEPTLKYAKWPLEIPNKDSASALAVCEAFVAVGTHAGLLLLLDPVSSKTIKRLRPHTATIYSISIDYPKHEYIATSSVDGKVSILSLAQSNDVSQFDLKRPVRAVALEPNYSQRKTRQFVSGGMAGLLTMHEKGWLGSKEVVIHSGEGAILAIQWRGTLIAWANEQGVRIWDTHSQEMVTLLPRSAGAPRPDLFKCTLQFVGDDTLLIAWADLIKVVSVRERARPISKRQSGQHEHAHLQVKTEQVFQVDCMISGIVPYLQDYIILAYLTPDNAYSDEAVEDRDLQRRVAAQRPELRIINAAGEELSADALSLTTFQRYSCNDYSLVVHPSQNRFYTVSPQDLIVAEPRDASDHIVWLLDHSRYEEALRALEQSGVELEAFDATEIGKKYLDHLIAEQDYAKAAEACPAVLGVNAKAWEDWIFLFVDRGHLETILPFVPTHDPRLSRTVYELILGQYMRKNPATLLKLLKKWPHDIYNVETVSLAVQSRIDKAPSAPILMECLVELYLMNRQFAKAVPLFLRLRRPGVFDLIKDHNLFAAVQDQAMHLVEFDKDTIKRKNIDEQSTVRQDVAGSPLAQSRHGAAIELLVDHTHSIPINRVVTQLMPRRDFLYMYLDALFDRDSQQTFAYSDLQVELYSEHDVPKLLDFLRASNDYSLEKAYQICSDKDLVSEMVFLLGRMGNNKQALNVIIQRLGDVNRAIQFAKDQNDHDLWEDLLHYAESRPMFIRALLENVGGEIDPLRLIKRINKGLEVPGLKPSIIKVMQDYNLQISLRHSCKDIIFSDARTLALELGRAQTRAFSIEPAGSLEPSLCHKCGLTLIPASLSASTIDEPADKTVAVLLFCRHVYHLGCLVEGSLPDRLPLGAQIVRVGPRTGRAARADMNARLRFQASLAGPLEESIHHCCTEGAT
ncbi:uncharacterized protein L969DRAFT_83952 [Mixia osmundae IAM 14324]|uniref:Vacuolar protein sorting-associated protein 41 n=1 Tax=Mixia osmundae (strain CBS 9802 / IAM 14324 / JCM 22182 / KY 12970) TaxID=764103 RepID=G7DV78_MIXOS|nr:uncharacterized protein L969DRAFT_83952 [Mixia osmundae IAM 14324]KEI42088.1 hypothetical protein L969DRAFT_83952 [Mixia osmundae IAM 14324]GAA94488.1 hypothetical protein E5Q_01140 [Mixia osmundae IAM 14324]